jgi:serine/threonine protein kinase/Flp pilus assembly protein TadD
VSRCSLTRGAARRETADERNGGSFPMTLTKLGHYRILGKIGAGGMGEVYRARDEQLHRDVAIKILPVGAAGDPTARSRLLREARAAAALNHPHVCTIHEVGEFEGQPFISMELIEGDPLDVAIPAAGLPPARVLRLGVQIADALAHAHQKGIVHRDLKPANVILLRDGRAKVLDFGLATRASGEPVGEATTQSEIWLSQPGSVAGTLPYMSPEQLCGRAADGRSDIWALGVLLYEMASGSRPFRGQTGPEVSARILKDAPPPLASGVPAPLRALIDRCLEKAPANRYQAAGEVRAALEAIESGAVSASAALARPVRRRLAVLPLRNFSGDPEQEYFVEGTHEALITGLAGIGALPVIARSSVMRYKDREAPLSEIAEQLKVDVVLTGSVMRIGEHVRITVQLVDVATEENLWGGRYDGEMRDVFSLQNEIVTAIVRAPELHLTERERARPAPRRAVDPEAYEAYLRGRFHWFKISREHVDTALQYFELALTRDPNCALAYAGIANVWMIRGDAGMMPAREALPKGRAAVEKALELDDSLAEAHEISGNLKFMYEWDWNGAEAEFRRAMELNPSSAGAHFFYSDFLISVGRMEEARAEMGRAQEFDPLNFGFQCFSGWHLLYQHRPDEAIEQLQKALRIEPNYSSARMGLWGAFYQKKLYEEAMAEARRFFAALGDGEVETALAKGYARGGYRGAMREAAETLVERSGRTYVPAIRIARLYAHASDKDKAFEWLKKAYEGRESPLVHLGVGWDWDDLRSDARFHDLLRRIHLPEGERPTRGSP